MHTILIIENNIETLQTLKEILTFHQYNVLTANKGSDGIIKAQNNSLDCILLDLNLSDISGFEVCAQLKKQEETQDIPILIITGMTIDYEEWEHGITIGAEDYLFKPFDAKQLLAKIKVLIKLKENIYTLKEKNAKLESIGTRLEESNKLLNITLDERTRLYEQVQISESRYRDLIENSPEMIYAINKSFRFVEVNNTALETLGYTKDELMKMTFLDLIPEEDLESAMEILPEFFEENNNLVELRLKRKDGSVFVSEIHTSLLFDPSDHEPLLARSYIRDISNRILLESQLLHSSKLASIGEMAAGVAHEINNPNEIIFGYSDLIKRGKVHSIEQAKEYASIIHENSLRIAKIIQNLLTYSRPTENIFVRCSINDIIEDTLSFALNMYKSANIFIQTNLKKDLPFIEAEYNAIQQVILNLLSNSKFALERSTKQDKIIQISTQNHQEDSQAFVRMIFYDNGIGIEKKDLTKIFDPFFTTKETNEGTGLGLSVSYNIVKHHRGKIRVNSQPSEYTEFIIDLPAKFYPKC